MINRVMNSRVAALALAAPLLFTAPALADHNRDQSRTSATVSIQTGNGGLVFSTGNQSYGRYGRNDGSYGHRNRNGRYHRRHQSRRSYGHHDDRDRRPNRYGQNRHEVRQMERQATRACRRAVLQEANYIGFYDVDFDRRASTRQTGPYTLRVRFKDVEFEGRGRDFERDVICTVNGGNTVKYIEGIPRWGRRDYSRYSQNDWQVYDRRHVGHDHNRGDYCPADYRY